MGRKPKLSEWTMIDQSMLSLFATFSIVEFTNRGSSIIDGIFVSRYLDASSIASLGIVKGIFSITGLIAGLMSIGMRVKCATLLGKGDVKNFSRVFSTYFYITLILSLLFAAALIFGARPLVILLGATGKGALLADGAVQYIRGIGIGVPALLLVPFMASACQLDNDRKRVRISGIIYFASNCIFDIVAVLTHSGLLGIGLATSFGTYAQLFCLFTHFQKKERMLTFMRFSTSPAEVREVLAGGGEKAYRYLGNILTAIISNRTIIFFGGAIAMSAVSIHRDIMTFAEIFASGLADALAMQVGVYYGEKNSRRIRDSGKSAHRLDFTVLGITGVLLLALSRLIADFYAPTNGELNSLVFFAAIITALYCPINALVRMRTSYLNAVEKRRVMNLYIWIGYAAYLVLCPVLGYLSGAYGLLASSVFSVIVMMIISWTSNSVRVRKFMADPEDYLMLPDSFDISPKDVIELEVRNGEDISLTSEQIQMFCKGHRIDTRTGMNIAVCFEELAVNVIRYGFPKCKKKPELSVRVVYTGEELTLRMKDNCPMFDVEHFIARDLNMVSDSEKNIGLKLVAGLSDNITYVHSLDSNNVILQYPLSLPAGTW